MIDIELIRRDPDAVRAGLARKSDQIDIGPILDLDRRRREIIGALDANRARRKQVAKEIGRARAQGGTAPELEAEAADIKAAIAAMEQELARVEAELNDRVAELPNIPDERVPDGGKDNNRVVRVFGEPPALPDGAADHVELCTRLDLVDYERGVKLGGSGFWIYKGLGAALEWALLDFFCREHFRDGYTFVLPPHLLVEHCGFAAGQFPKFRDDVFHLQTAEGERERFLLPTAETAILNIYGDEILDRERLPLKMFAYTPCYRREAGGYRTDERGTIRGHQFNKVEMFQFVEPDDADAALQELVRRAESIVEKLGLHFRTSLLAARDVSDSMKMTYDVEVWIPSLGGYKEVSSASWAGDYQARRANIRYRPEGQKRTAFVHTLNASGLATSRLLPALVEQLQQPDGSVLVPEPLRPWLGVDRIVPPA
ncbi:MAG: serine--tRNA ligase [Deltaproteobacteria bacterium]|nr:MAG: serine--tRNA ligase [Deltaproteobacteria bacterium]